jgi:hypothetical protein
MALSGGPSADPNNPRGVNAGNPLETAARMAAWPTPNAMGGGQTSRGGDRKDELLIGGLVGSWATPTTRDHKDGYSEGTVDENGLLGRQVWQVGWPTPTMNNAQNSVIASQETAENEAVRRGWNNSLAVAAFAPWPTPNTINNGVGEDYQAKIRRGMNPGLNPADAAALVLPTPWATPTACSPNSLRGYGQDPETRKAGGHAVNLQDQVRLTASGPTPSGSPAATEKRGQLNPDFSLWLMGIPIEWALCVPRETQSVLRKRKNLLLPPSTQCANWSDEAGTCTAAYCRFPDCDPSMKGKT